MRRHAKMKFIPLFLLIVLALFAMAGSCEKENKEPNQPIWYPVFI